MVFSHYDSKFIMVLKETLSILHRYVILTSMCKITWSHIIEISTFAKIQTVPVPYTVINASKYIYIYNKYLLA
jgi:hypothetical protein